MFDHPRTIASRNVATASQDLVSAMRAPGANELPATPLSTFAARLAYVEVPDFSLAALLRAHPELRGQPVAVVSGGGTHAKVLCASPEAKAGGVACGLGAARARQRLATLVVRPPSPEAERSSQAALLEVAFAFSPKVEEAGPGAVYLDLGGMDKLYPSEPAVATALDIALERLGLPCRVGVAGGKTIARLAARLAGQGQASEAGVHVVPPGAERAFLEPLPLALLEPPPEVRDRLLGWGVRTLGQLAALSITAVARRLGPEGVRLQRLAAGEGDLPFVAVVPPPLYEEACSFDDWSISTLEPLLFALGQAVERLLERVGQAALALRAVTVAFRLEPRGNDVRHLEFAAPLTGLKAIMELARHELALRPPAAAVTGLRVVGLPATPQAVQGHLFAPPDPTPERLAVTLARLRALVGEAQVGAPARPADKRPTAIATVPFRPAAETSAPPKAQTRKVRSDGASGTSGSPTPLLTARVLRPPRIVAVSTEGDRPSAVFLEGQRMAICHCAGPWRLRDGWWTADPVDRDDYDAELADGRLIRLYRDRRLGSWFLEGFYG